MVTFDKKERVYNLILEISKNLADQKKGALFVLAPKEKLTNIYECLYPKILSNHSIFDKGAKALIEKLAELDGAFLLSHYGELVAYGARIKKSIPIKGYGTKHAAASGITQKIKGSTAILVSEETNWIKIFREGRIILEMDGTKKSPPTLTHKVMSFLTDNDTALITTAGASAALVGFLPVVVVSGTYLAVKTASGIIKKSLQ